MCRQIGKFPTINLFVFMCFKVYLTSWKTQTQPCSNIWLMGCLFSFLRNIPQSPCFEQTADMDDDPPPLSVHFAGWKSAHDDPDITSELVAEELRQGWVSEFPGTLEKAQAAYPIGVSVGKLGVATSTTRGGLISLRLKSKLPFTRKRVLAISERLDSKLSYA